MSSIRSSRSKNLSPQKKCVIFIVPVLILLVVGIYSIVTRYNAELKCNQYKEEGSYTTGIISDVDKRTERKKRNGKRRKSTSYYVYGNYTVEGSVYSFSYKSKTYVSEGTDVTVFYDKYNPSDYIIEGRLDGSYFGGVLSLGFAALFASFSVREFIRLKNGSKENVYNSSSANDRYYGYNQNMNGDPNVGFYGENVNSGPNVGFYGENVNSGPNTGFYGENNYQSGQTTSNYNDNQDDFNGNLGSTAFYKRNK